MLSAPTFSSVDLPAMLARSSQHDYRTRFAVMFATMAAVTIAFLLVPSVIFLIGVLHLGAVCVFVLTSTAPATSAASAAATAATSVVIEVPVKPAKKQAAPLPTVRAMPMRGRHMINHHRRHAPQPRGDHEGFVAEASKGYGFIRSLSFRKDVFFHMSEWRGAALPVAGTTVSFSTSANPLATKDSFVATGVAPVGPAPTTPTVGAAVTVPSSAFANMAARHKEAIKALQSNQQQGGVKRHHITTLSKGPDNAAGRGFAARASARRA
jgi:cold shock CspA family protein